MRKLFTLFAALACFAGIGVYGQTYITIPHYQNFELFSNCGGSCASSCALQSGWTNDPSMSRDFSVDVGGTSSSSTGPSTDFDPGTSSGKYLYCETSSPCYSGTNTWGLLTPYINISGANAPQLEFWYHMYGQSMGTMHVDGRPITGGTPGSWQLDIVPSWTDNIDLWQSRTVSVGSITGSDTVQIRIRYQNPTNFYGDAAVDAFNFYDLLPNDAGVARIDSPSTPACALGSNVYATICNYGTDTLTSVSINWEINSTAQTPYSWTGALAPGECDSLIFVGTGSISAGDDLTMYTSNPNGMAEGATGAGNDTTSMTVELGLSGTYTVGGAGADYTDFNDALVDVYTYGVCGPVVFNVYDSTYNEQLMLSGTPIGASATNTITFQAASGMPKLTFYGISSIANYTIGLSDADHFIFRNLAIENTGITYGRVLEFQGGSDWNMFEGNWILGDTTPTTTSTNHALIYSAGGLDNYNSFHGNTMHGGSYGIYWRGDGSASTSQEEGTTFEDNTLLGNYYMGSYFYYHKDVVYKNNHYEGTSNYTGSNYRFYFAYVSGGFEFTGNSAYGTNYGYGAYFNNVISSAASRGLVANNSLHIGNPLTTSTSYGIYMTNAGYLDVVNNSVNLESNGSSARAIYITGGGVNNIWNNIFVNMGPGYGVYLNSSFAVTNMDYNNIYAPNGNVGYYNGAQPSMADWQNASGNDQNGTNVDPMFVSGDDLHVCNDTLNGAGFSTGLISEDFDGDMRDPMHPDIGADEFAPLTPGFLGADVDICAGDSISFTVGAPGDVVNWSTGSTSRTLWITAPGTYSVQVTGVCGTGSDTIVIGATADVYFDFLSASSNSACDGDTITLNGQAGYDSYLWSTGDTTQSIQVTAAGSYTLDVTDACGSGSENISVSFISAPTAAFTSTNSWLTCSFTNGSTNGGGNNSYMWDFGDGNSSTLENPVHVYSSSGMYVVTLTVTNACGSDTYTDTCYTTVTGLEDALSAGTTVFPNPNNGSFTLEFNLESAMEIDLRIVNMQGKEVMAETIGSVSGNYQHAVNLGGIPAGIYFAQITGDDHTVIKKIVVE